MEVWCTFIYLHAVHRLEVCSDLAQEGLTPTQHLMDNIMQSCSNIIVHVMIRNRPGNFFYSDNEVDEMVKTIETMKQRYQNISGFVFGCLENGDKITINENQTMKLIQAARPMSVTFHKAFDLIHDPIHALNVLKRMKVDRVLTSGCSGLGLSGKACDHLSMLQQLVDHAKDDIIILAGGGVRTNNVVKIIQETRVKEVHSSQIVDLSSPLII
jgi:copper homeostasis protein